MWSPGPVALFALLVPYAAAQQVGAPTDALDKLSVDDLFSVQVTSVGRKAQELSKAPAAVFVLTAEDIRRSGATCIPEALQWVPGLTVLHVDGRSWVVSARGDARLYADKMLVLVDGRSLYVPAFSGVIWDMILVPMQDIERIEVVLGPGAVMWGPNAVNGVINIITKSTASASGGQASVSTGNEVRNATELDWGGPLSSRFSYRAWGMFDYRTPAFGSPGYDQLDDEIPYRQNGITNLNAGSASVGFRMEGALSPIDQWMVQGSVYKMDGQSPFVYAITMPDVVAFSQGHSAYLGGNFQTVWTRTHAPGNESTLQFSYSHDNTAFSYLSSLANNLTLDYQNRRQTGTRNEIYWGAGYQQYWDDSTASRFLTILPASATYRDGDAVVRDEYQLVPERLMVSLGVRFDYNSFTHLEYQPSVRLLFTPDRRQSAWMAVSRAVRVPSRLNRDVHLAGGSVLFGELPISISLNGSQSLRAEVDRSIEAGYRFQSGQRWSMAASLFGSYYGRLMGMAGPAVPIVSLIGSVPVFSVPFTYCNCGSGRSYGAEISGAWHVREGWRILPSYSYLNESRWLPAGNFELYQWDTIPNTIPHQFLMRSQHDLSRKLQFDLMARARSRDAAWNLPGAFLLDARLGWRPIRSGEFSIAVQNLTNRQILETYAESPFLSIPIRCTFVVKWTQRF